MSPSPDNEFDLEKLFLPAWAQEPSTAKNYENYKGEEAPSRRRESFGPRPPRRDRPAGPGRPGGQGGPRRDRPQGQGQDRQGGPGQQRYGRPGDRRGRGDFQGRQEHREPPLPLPEVNVNLVPEEKGVESLARQIKITGRAYPLFDIAQMILQKPERHSVTFSVKKGPEGQVLQPLFLCALDETLWLSEDEAVSHVLKKHFATFYQAERTPTEPPKGRYTFVAQCGMSGVILGPPNHHDYQNQLRKLHAERFSRMPFEAYKSRVRIVSDEEVVKKWVEDQSWKTEYICLNLPEPLKLTSLDAVEKHFRETHKEAIIKQVESYTLTGTAARNLRNPQLTRAMRSAWEEQRRFPLKIATTLSQQFASRGLQFFKVNKTLTHVSVARPHYLDLSTTPVSEGVRKIVDYLNSHTKTTRRQLFEALLPESAIKPVAPPPAAPPVQAATEGQVAPAPASGEAQPAAAATETPAPAPAPQPSPEQTALVADLHWLIHQGHVIEFANGTIETAKKPAPKPPKPEKKPTEAAPKAEAGVPAAEAAPAVQTEPGPGTPVAPEGAIEGAAPAEAATTAAPEEPATPASPEPGVQTSSATEQVQPETPGATPEADSPNRAS